MLYCTGYETRKIMDGSAAGLVRMGECPYLPGDEIVLTSDAIDKDNGDGKSRHIPFAKAQVISVRPGTVRQFKQDKMTMSMDGYENGNVWVQHHRSNLYKSMKDTDKVHHVKFRITQIDKMAGRRGNVA